MAKRTTMNLLAGFLVVVWAAGGIESNPQPSSETGADARVPVGVDTAGLPEVAEKTDLMAQDVVAADTHAADEVAVGDHATDAADQSAASTRSEDQRVRRQVSRVDRHGLVGAQVLDRPVFHHFLLSRCLSIAGGTSQILLSVVAERALGLPRDEAR